jgi:hypothetical protein
MSALEGQDGAAMGNRALRTSRPIATPSSALGGGNSPGSFSSISPGHHQPSLPQGSLPLRMHSFQGRSGSPARVPGYSRERFSSYVDSAPRDTLRGDG